ncbi:hypothetical protein WG70_06835 [Burkholderia oklahomensis EO147]|nr:hypothetical protein WG70_06835 [Burkholderia oklahomensis EO147]KUY53734.1 hypothetical protein WG70_13725 [Burkholderia oklahomensis EO147]
MAGRDGTMAHRRSARIAAGLSLNATPVAGARPYDGVRAFAPGERSQRDAFVRSCFPGREAKSSALAAVARVCAPSTQRPQ